MGISFDINLNKCVYAKYKLINYPLNYYCSKRIYAFTSFIFPKKSTLKKKKSIKHRKHEFLPSSAPDTEHRKTRYESWRDVAAMLLGSFLKGCI